MIATVTDALNQLKPIKLVLNIRVINLGLLSLLLMLLLMTLVSRSASLYCSSQPSATLTPSCFHNSKKSIQGVVLVGAAWTQTLLIRKG